MITNDQQDIIKAIIDKDYLYAWERVKYIGYMDVPDINERYILFHRAIIDFNPAQNNNFILFYKQYLKFLKFDRNETFRVTENRSTIKKLKEQAISPTKDNHSKLIDELSKWNN